MDRYELAWMVRGVGRWTRRTFTSEEVRAAFVEALMARYGQAEVEVRYHDYARA